MPQASGLAIFRQTRLDGTVITLGQTADTSRAFVETKDLDMDKDDFFKFIDTLLVDISDRGFLSEMTVTIKFRDDLDADLGSADELSLLNAASELPIRPRDSVYFRVRFEDTFVQTRWFLRRFQLFGGLAGERI